MTHEQADKLKSRFGDKFYTVIYALLSKIAESAATDIRSGIYSSAISADSKAEIIDAIKKLHTGVKNFVLETAPESELVREIKTEFLNLSAQLSADSADSIAETVSTDVADAVAAVRDSITESGFAPTNIAVAAAVRHVLRRRYKSRARVIAEHEAAQAVESFRDIKNRIAGAAIATAIDNLQNTAEDNKRRTAQDEFNDASDITDVDTSAIAAAIAARRFNDASRLAGKIKKRWRTMGDTHVRLTHHAAGGQIVGADELFIVGGFELLYPTDRLHGAPTREVINCRCSVSYYIDE